MGVIVGLAVGVVGCDVGFIVGTAVGCVDGVNAGRIKGPQLYAVPP